MKDLSAIPLEELLGDLIDARVDARTCRLIIDLKMAIGGKNAEAQARIDGNLQQIEVITGELARRGITYLSVEVCP